MYTQYLIWKTRVHIFYCHGIFEQLFQRMEYEKISLWRGLVTVSHELLDILVVKSTWGGMGHLSILLWISKHLNENTIAVLNISNFNYVWPMFWKRYRVLMSWRLLPIVLRCYITIIRQQESSCCLITNYWRFVKWQTMAVKKQSNYGFDRNNATILKCPTPP